MAALMKMECYPYLICFALFASFNCTLQFTYNYDPSISGTYPPRDLRCPKECNCTYVAKGDFLELGYNYLKYKDVEHDAFRGLTKLKYLSISNNDQLAKLRAAWFVDLVSLEALHLEQCGIDILESDVFKP
ncbi:uncharacterized protein LOC117107570, partial [Anneissia japonica]|uniref:uncharacterized protein LOC117107570 n=1 Tax=Anneissia japonica TaxID=1529436 RepID=UPI00142593E4